MFTLFVGNCQQSIFTPML